MTRTLQRAAVAALLIGVSAFAVRAGTMATPEPVPDAPKFDAQGQITFVGIKDIAEYKALPEYHEPDWVTKNFVDTGKLPPVKDRLPKEPMVYKTANMKDGIGVYGDVMRHVIGGRPEGCGGLGEVTARTEVISPINRIRHRAGELSHHQVQIVYQLVGGRRITRRIGPYQGEPQGLAHPRGGHR